MADKDLDHIMFLSIVTPCYNAGGLLTEALDSAAEAIAVIGKRHPQVRVEQVVFDDGSDDRETLALLDSVPGRFPFCRVLRAEIGRQGPAAARNRAIEAANGDWIGFLDADDHVRAEGLAALVTAALASGDAAWVIGDSAAFFTDGRVEPRLSYCRRTLDPQGQTSTFVSQETLLGLLAGPPNLFTGAWIARKNLIERAGGFPEGLLFSEDWYLTLSMAALSGACYVPEAVLEFRRGHSSLTQSSLALTAIVFGGARKAIGEARFAPVRKQLRWTLLAQIKALRDRCRAAGLRWRAVRFGLLAWRVAPEDPRLLGAAFGCLFGRRKA